MPQHPLLVALLVAWAAGVPLKPFPLLAKRVASAAAAASTLMATTTAPSFASSTLSAAALVDQGMAHFRVGDVPGSVLAFDAAVALRPELRGVLWQRGLSLYYAGRYTDCSQQFRGDIALNQQDAEEIVWTALCEAQDNGFGAASAAMPALPLPERRPIMREVLALFRGEHAPDALLRAGDVGSTDSAAFFYSRLYLGLYYEANGDADRAAAFVRDAVESPYARRGSSDYMIALAKVHQQQRRGGGEP